MTKSYFNPIDTQNIRHGEEHFLIQGEFIREELPEKIHCGVQKGKVKQFRRNKKDYSRLSGHIGLLPVVMISPADSSLITEGSEERRKFMNAVISQFDREYLESLMRYNRALRQRNIFQEYYQSISEGREQIGLKYYSQHGSDSIPVRVIMGQDDHAQRGIQYFYKFCVNIFRQSVHHPEYFD
ncbi:DNA replication and repair protein RecF [subsurface metagenome]